MNKINLCNYKPGKHFKLRRPDIHQTKNLDLNFTKNPQGSCIQPLYFSAKIIKRPCTQPKVHCQKLCSSNIFVRCSHQMQLWVLQIEIIGDKIWFTSSNLPPCSNSRRGQNAMLQLLHPLAYSLVFSQNTIRK